MKKKTVAHATIFLLTQLLVYSGFASDVQSEEVTQQTASLNIPIIIALCVVIAVLIAMLIVAKIGANKLKSTAKQSEEIVKSSIIDKATGLLTRHKFCDDAQDILKKATPAAYILLSIDIDAFRIINEVYGYDMGTKVLQKTADIIKETYNGCGIVGRDKDDVFVILKKNEGSIENLNKRETCEVKIQEGVKELLGEHYDINLSQGGYIIGNTDEPVSKMIDLSNSARLKGKKQHGTTFYEFTEKMKEYREKRHRIVFSMESALKHEEFTLQYQPKVDLNTFEIAGAEALVRWNTGGGDAISPNEFIEVFEENGFIYELDCYVLTKVCKFLKEHQSMMRLPKIAVNVSGYSLLKPNIRQTLTRILNEHNVSKNQIELEIAESFLVGEKSTIENKIKDLREGGFTIALDDFGSGVSSLSRLRDIKVDIIKLDREFLNYGLTESRGTIVIGNMIKMSKNLLMQIVAEGVENKNHLHILKFLKCDMAQGYYFEKPLSEQDFLTIIAQRKDYKHLIKT